MKTASHVLPQWGPPTRTAQLSQCGSESDDAATAGGGDTADQADAVLQSYMDAYTDAEKSEASFGEGLQRVREHLLSGQRGAAVCLICLESVQRSNAVWACQRSCSSTFHLLCIQAWARQQAQAAALKASEVAQQEAGGEAPLPVWCCPKCRCEYSPAEAPSEYRCFCGAQRDPAPDPWLPPHTCGETCSRALGCGHSCVLLCHPGPCPPCPRLVSAACHCGKQHTQRRCQAAAFSCTKLCGKRQSCGHRCALRCHTGDCPLCQLESSRTCQCGAETAAVPCSVVLFQCDRVCGAALGCGRHRCEQRCHAGGCGSCPEEGVRHCPCGKARFEDLLCDEPTPLCGDTCGKVLACGQHTCTERCHVGPCPALCRALVAKTCLCSRLRKELPCCEPLRCERRCPQTRSCGRHPCKRRCCSGGCPPCQEVCGRVLKCSNHRCPATCHEGACLPCPLEFSVACACGDASYRLPCGWEARAAVPRCTLPCRVPRTCRHAAQHPLHRCHFGPCPPCLLPCATQLLCGHQCIAPSCHDTCAPPTAPFQPPLPPLAAAYAAVRPDAVRARSKDDVAASAPALKAAAEAATLLESGAAHPPCPECRQPVSLPCLGGHTQLRMPCSEASPASCGACCGRRLPCGSHFASGRHSCGLPCHTVSAWGEAAGRECESCTLRCGRGRACGHPCEAPCHSGACRPCALPVVQPCHCGKSSVTLDCHSLHECDADLPGLVSDMRCCGKACHRPLPACPHPCEAACHPGLCASACPATVTVRCECKRRKGKLACSTVQARLAEKTGGDGAYDVTTILRLLPCDATCMAVQASKVDVRVGEEAAGRALDNKPAAESDVSAAERPADSASAAGGGTKKRMNKEERLRDKAAAVAKASKGRRLRQVAALIQKTWLPILVVLLGVVTALYLQKILAF